MPGSPCPVGGKGGRRLGSAFPLLLDVECMDFCEESRPGLL